MAIVTLFIAVAFALVWFLETNTSLVLSPFWEKAIEVAGIALLYLLFARLTSWRKKSAAETDQASLDDESAILVAYASQTGVADEIARRTAAALEQGGRNVRLLDFSKLDISLLKDAGTALFIASTTGEGDPPDAAVSFAVEAMTASAELEHLNYAILALGDRNYAEFCGFGRRLDIWLQESGATALFGRIDVDRGDEKATAAWFGKLERFGATGGVSAPAFDTWRLSERHLLNPGSDNPPVFHVSLSPSEESQDWRAGDIAVVSPRNEQKAVEDVLRAMRLDGDVSVTLRGEAMTLAEALAQLALPDSAGCAVLLGVKPQALVDELPLISAREYSLASLPADGKAELVVRQMRHGDGRLGAGSGWLTEHARLGSDIEMRLRSNVSFHGPEDARPMILIGAGSGIAGLRAHMKERIAAGHRRNWLIFGERSMETDYLFGDEIEGWKHGGSLSRLDLCFFDGGRQQLAQNVLRENKTELCNWLRQGATIYVTGSRSGIGKGVHDALEGMLGADGLHALSTQGDYKTDVY